ncbi:alpha/beta fold hydrolase [Sphingobium phenoxybenzoativorans]|uniref:Alpha/beta fold hydrolase n=1 Tax=Sphingobium phenoxybenzoativorans TaxID=1592790 RepID=A0A975K886_9SPHN|nr:alpha/beta fold hydrolase [Sphingobium phenoxybenzoativorans]QUT06184.1 alpha/beta fold hydrolase [Sphingobium phenoxybenzoativorans]
MATILAPHDSAAVPAALAPSARMLAREVRAFAYMRCMSAFGRAVPLSESGEGRTVVVIPGFLASDSTTARLRKSLEKAGFAVHGWGLGRNRGVTADILERLDARMAALGVEGPVTLVGWSLGGLIAREYAKYAPERVEKVITLGSPFSGSLRANNAWRVYERIAGHPVDRPPVAVTLPEKPVAHTIACWSARDGVVSPASARGRSGERDRAHELDCTHMAFVAHPRAIRTVAKLILD